MAIFCIMTKDFTLMIICFRKVYWASRLCQMGKIFTHYVSSLLVHQRKQGLLKSKTRSCYFMQLPTLKETREIILLLSQVVWSPLRGRFLWVILNADVVRFTSEIFAQLENNISFCVTGASLCYWLCLCLS